MSQFEFTYEGEAKRLDVILIEALSANPSFCEITRSQLKNWVEAKAISVNGKIVSKAGALVKSGSLVTVKAPIFESELSAYQFTLEILYEDECLLVLNKPPALSMHPGAGNKSKTLANAIIAHLQSKGEIASDLSGSRPGIVHRLDRDTTGLVVVAKTLSSHNQLSQQFSARSVKRAYKALVLCPPRAARILRTQDCGKIDSGFGRHPNKRTLMAVRPDSTRRAVTHWQVLERMQQACLVELRLETGRTHQIRVHMQHIGCPVIGDKSYGDFSALPKKLQIASAEFGRQALHAFELEFSHPLTNKRMHFEAKLPYDFEQLLEVFRSHV